MLGFEIKKNFDRPYLSQNMREFWTRWHISLSTWLRDYLYIPLGGNRAGPTRTTINLMITMLLGGLWHGAAWNFVLWGAYHGLLLAFSRGADRHVTEQAPLSTRVRRRFVCFHLVLVGWLLFRVTSLEHLAVYARGLAQFSGGLALHPYFVIVLAAAAFAHYVPQARIEAFAKRWIALPIPLQAAAYAGAILAFCGVTMEAPSFIYFQF
jgi:D-alanyl-lipoteichoic acid acyltransferase DltB (MBOAT superfamily)